MAWKVVTGGAGFIGCNLACELARRGEKVRIIDNFSTGRRSNIAGLLKDFPHTVDLIEGSVTEPEFLGNVFSGADVVFHQAAVPSVQKSIEDPLRSHHHNITGTLAVLLAARECGVRRVIYAASSSAYGDTPTLPKVETMPPPGAERTV